MRSFSKLIGRLTGNGGRLTSLPKKGKASCNLGDDEDEDDVGGIGGNVRDCKLTAVDTAGPAEAARGGAKRNNDGGDDVRGRLLNGGSGGGSSTSSPTLGLTSATAAFASASSAFSVKFKKTFQFSNSFINRLTELVLRLNVFTLSGTLQG